MQVDRLIGQIYETIDTPDTWRDVIHSLSQELGAHASWLMQPGELGPVLYFVKELAQQMSVDYGNYYHTVDILVQVGMKRYAGVDVGSLREQDIIDKATWRTSELFNDFIKPNGLSTVLTAPLAPVLERAPPVLTFYRRLGAETFSTDDVKIYDAVLPHLRRAIRLRNAIVGESGATGAPMLLEQMQGAVMLLSASGHMLHANTRARAILDMRAGLVSQQGRLTAASHQDAANLARIVAASLGRQPRGGEMLLRRPDGGLAWLTVTPLPRSTGTLFSENNCRACVTVSDLLPADRALARRLVTLFRLTAAEARIATSIAEGLSPADIAAMRGVAVSTIRSQIKAVYGKLHVRRQSELMRLLTRLSRPESD